MKNGNLKQMKLEIMDKLDQLNKLMMEQLEMLIMQLENLLLVVTVIKMKSHNGTSLMLELLPKPAKMQKNNI